MQNDECSEVNSLELADVAAIVRECIEALTLLLKLNAGQRAIAWLDLLHYLKVQEGIQDHFGYRGYRVIFEDGSEGFTRWVTLEKREGGIEIRISEPTETNTEEVKVLKAHA